MPRALNALMLALSLGVSIPCTASSALADDGLQLDETVYLRNLYAFSGGRQSGGASASFIELDGVVYVLTAKHLLGSAMGIEPEVLPTQFDANLVGWMVFTNPDVYDEQADPLARITAIHNPNNSASEDLIVLRTDVRLDAVRDRVLPLADTAVSAGEAVYLVGCTYAEQAACTQNIYRGTVTRATGAEIMFNMQAGPSSLAGFSGAPLLNADREIVGVLAGSYGAGAYATAIPDWLAS